jgi:hypothetical protein
MLVYAVMAAVRWQANAITPKKTTRRPSLRSSAGPSRKFGASP